MMGIDNWKVELEASNSKRKIALMEKGTDNINQYHWQHFLHTTYQSLNCQSGSLINLDRMRRAFLWKGRANMSSFHCPVNWDFIYKSKEQVSLKVKD